MWHRALDADGRLRVPIQVRDELAPGAVVSRPLRMTECVEIWPTRQFDEYAAGWLRQAHSPDREELERFFWAAKDHANIDGYGRLFIPAFLRAHARLEKWVTVRGAGDHLEIRRRAILAKPSAVD